MGDIDAFVLGRDLSQTPFANVLTTALKQKLTGELLIRHAQGENHIYFRNGMPAGTQVMHSFKPFGRILIELGWITESQLEASVIEMGKGKRQGEALVAMGALTPEKLDEALKLHQLRNLTEIARLKSGQLLFKTITTAPPWAAEVAPNALRILKTVLAVPESDGVCQSLFDRVGMDALVVIPPHLVTTTSHFELDAQEREALKLLEAPMTLKQFLIRSHLPPEKARSLAAVLLVTALLVTPEHAVPEGADQLLPKGNDADRERRRRMRDRAITNLGGSPFGRRPTTGTFPVQPAPSAGGSADLPDFADAGPSVTPTPTPSLLTADERRLKQLIEDKARLLPTLDAFGKLGLNQAATKDQIKQAFLHAAKVFHPDHLPPALAALAPQQRDVFAAIKEAYDLLLLAPPATPSAAGGRKETQSGVSGISRAREDEARTLATQGERAMKVRDYPSAADSFHQAYELSPRGDYLACEAWALFSDPARKANQKQARELLERASTLHPESEKVAQYMGTLARIEGQEEQALTWLKKASAYNPKNREVADELHLLDLRRRQKR